MDKIITKPSEKEQDYSTVIELSEGSYYVGSVYTLFKLIDMQRAIELKQLKEGAD